MSALYPDHASLPVDQLRVTSPTPLDPIEFWTCDDCAERLSCSEFEEAVIQHIDGWGPGVHGEADPGLETLLRKTIAPLTVYGFSRAEVTDERLQAEAEGMVDHLVERLNEDEWGDPDGQHEVFEELGQKALLPLVLDALKRVRHHIEPWHCEVSQTVVLDADQLVALVRELEPGWFEA